MELSWSRRLRHWPPRRVDGGLAVAAAVATLAGAIADGIRSGRPDLTIGGATLLVGSAAATVWRRRAPLPVAFVSGGFVLWYGVARQPDPPLQLGLLLALYTVAARCSRRITTVAVAATVAAGVLAIVLARDATAESIYAPLLSSLLAIALGDRTRVQAAYLAAMKERADRIERDRENEAERAVAAERTRIARELHDIVAHHVSLMVVQAEAGAARAEQIGAEADAFDRIASAGRAALTELRRVLGALDDSTRSGVHSPQPGLRALDNLARGVTEAGVPVEVRREGDVRALPAGLELSAYRIVQEALTNVVRHGEGAPATVVVRFEPDALSIEVVDVGPPRRPLAPHTGAGRGLVNVRERVQVLGGSFEAGPRREGGFRVAARLPLDG